MEHNLNVPNQSYILFAKSQQDSNSTVCVIRALQQVLIQGCFPCSDAASKTILTLFGLLLLVTAKWGRYQVLGPDLEASSSDTLRAHPIAMQSSMVARYFS